MAYVSREDEDEADARAVGILRAAGYDPQLLVTALIKLHGRDGAQHSTGPWDSHPSMSDRIENIRTVIQGR